MFDHALQCYFITYIPHFQSLGKLGYSVLYICISENAQMRYTLDLLVLIIHTYMYTCI